MTGVEPATAPVLVAVTLTVMVRFWSWSPLAEGGRCEVSTESAEKLNVVYDRPFLPANQPSDQDAQLLAEDLMVAHEGEWEERREWSVVAVAEVEA